MAYPHFKVITHKGKLYARFYKVDNGTPANVTYLIDGVIATEEQDDNIIGLAVNGEMYNIVKEEVEVATTLA